MGSLLLIPGLDTRLARALLERRRVEYPTLHAALTKVRALRQTSPHTLALELVELGLVDAGDLEATLAELLGEQGERWLIGETVAGLELRGSLGAGGMGEVLLARDLETGSEVAVKTLRIDEDTDLLARFQREAEAQARVDAHPNVVRIHRSGTAGGRAFLVMDAVRGGDLARRLAEGPLKPRAAAELVRDLALGLAYAHARGVLHRDLKPANVLFGERGEPRLADFGLARLLEADALTQTGEILGTPSYMAPEQANSGAQDERTDVYGLGGILYASLTGSPPFEGGSVYALLEQVMTAPAPDPRKRVEGIPAGLAEICLRCLEKSPKDRYAGALELSAALSGVLEGEPLRPRWRKPLALVLALLTLALSFAWAGARARHRERGLAETPAPASASATPERSRTPSVAEVRAEMVRLGPGLKGALLAESYLARGLKPAQELKARAAEPFFLARIDEVTAAIPLEGGRVFAWRGSKSFGKSLAFLLDQRSPKPIRSWNERFLGATARGTRLAFLTGERTLRVVETRTWQELFRFEGVAPLGACFGADNELWLVGSEGLSLLSLKPGAVPSQVWTPPPGGDASAVYPLENGNVLVASGRTRTSLTYLRLISPQGRVLWESARNAFDGKPRCLSVSPDERWTLFGTASGQIALFDTAAEPGGIREPVRMFERPLTGRETVNELMAGRRAHRKSTVSLNWLSNDHFLSTDANPPTYNLWRRSGEPISMDQGRDLAPRQINLSSDGRLLYIGSDTTGLVTGVLRSSRFPEGY